MVEQVPLRPKELSTALLRATEGLIVSVNHHVVLQVLLIVKPL